MMDLALAAVAETLAYEFGHLQGSAVVRVLTDCADDFPYDGPHFIEQAARARLSRLEQPQAGWYSVPVRCSLDVSLHDDDLADEVELTARLMVAANEVEHALAQEEVDAILGVQSLLLTSP